MQQRRGETLIDFVMSLSGVLGAAVMIAILSQATSLPKWACFVIGLPLGMIAAWLSMFVLFGAVLFLIFSPVALIRNLIRTRNQRPPSQ